MKSINPKNNELIKSYEILSAKELGNKIDQSHSSFLSWKQTTFSERANLMKAVAKELIAQKEELAVLMANEMGKPLSEGRSEIEKCSKVCEFYAEKAEAFLKPEIIDASFEKSYVNYSPLGVVLAIMPWNYPFWQVFRFAAPTLMAGNTALLKHAENVSGCSLAIEKIFEKVGFPKAVFSSLLINIEMSESVIENPKVRAVTLTGSTKAGKAVAALAGKNLKKTVLELGGNDAYIVFKDANLPLAAKKICQSRLLNNGQSCIAAKRFIVHETIVDDFTKLLIEEMKGYKVGDPLLSDTQIGPMAREDLRDEVHKQVKASIDNGAKCLIGGKLTDKEGAFYPITLLTGVKKGMPAFDDEIFGPVGAIISFNSDDEAISLANDSGFGLGGGLFTKDIAKAEKIAREKFNSGACFINDFTKSDPKLPFGGIKDSGYGRELSHFGIKEFMNAKTICIS